MKAPVYPDAPFPVERLVVASGQLSASAHKNPYNPLHLDWDFYVKFKPFIVGKTTHHTAIHIEIETKGIWRLDDFAGMDRHDTDPDFNIGSFYLFDHRPSCDTHFKVHSVRGTKLDIEADLMVDVVDSYIDRKPPLRRVHVRTHVVFNGILVSSYGTQSKPDERTLMRVAKKLFDVTAFGPPTKAEEIYQGKPVLNLDFKPLS